MKRYALLPLLLVALAGCGSEDGDDSAAPAAGGQIEISETEFAIDPKSPSVDAAGETTIHVVNNGSETHALEIEGNGLEEETDDIAPGESAELTVDLKDGEYEIYCPIDGHKAQGMEGELTVGGAMGGTGTDTGENEDEDETDTGEDGGYGG